MLPGQQQSEASTESYQKRWDSGRHRNVDLSPHETEEHNWARDSHLAGRAHPKGRRGSPRHSPGCPLICRCRAILKEWGWRRRSTIEIYGLWINGNSLLYADTNYSVEEGRDLAKLFHMQWSVFPVVNRKVFMCASFPLLSGLSIPFSCRW